MAKINKRQENRRYLLFMSVLLALIQINVKPKNDNMNSKPVFEINSLQSTANALKATTYAVTQ